MPKIHTTERFRVVHDSRMRPDDWKRFVEFPHFTRKWRDLGMDDDDLRALQLMLTVQPHLGPVISGTGGLRKVRFSRHGSGKRSGVRIGYAYYEEFGIVCLITVYAKSEQEDISAGTRKQIAKLLRVVGSYLDSE